MIQKESNKKNLAILIAAVLLVSFALITTAVYALTDTTRPTIISVSPANNEKGVSPETAISVIQQIFVKFSEEMNPSTINTNTFTLMQRTTPASGDYKSLAIAGTITYSGGVAVFTPDKQFTPNEEFGNVFTATITTGAKDLAGNSLSRNYVWSFTTGNDPFNTGTTTSQQDQSAIPFSGPAIVSSPTQPPVQPPIVTSSTNTQTATTSTFPWMWVIGGLLLLLLIALILALTLMPASKKDKKTVQVASTTRSNPFGDIHPVISLEGIGPEYSKKLQTIGIKNTKQLWEADAVKVAYRTGAPLSSVKSWQHMAELASVKDIGPQYAELLERSGIHTISQLKKSDPNTVLRLIRKKENSLKIDIQGNSPGHATVEHWIAEARDHRFHESIGETA